MGSSKARRRALGTCQDAEELQPPPVVTVTGDGDTVKIVRGDAIAQGDMVVLSAGDQSPYYIGVSLEPLSEALRVRLGLEGRAGMTVTGVLEGGAAAKAGIRKHDVILRCDDRPVVAAEDIGAALSASGGKPVKLLVIRSGKRVEVSVTPDRRASHPQVVLQGEGVKIVRSAPGGRVPTPT